jgi:hypothetical protein
MSMRPALLAITFVLAGAAQGRADGLDIRSGEQLLAACRSSESEEAVSCRRYVTIVTETILIARAASPVCFFLPPDSFTEEQAMVETVNYLTAHPEQQSLPGAKTIIDALASKYPCPQ